MSQLTYREVKLLAQNHVARKMEPGLNTMVQFIAHCTNYYTLLPERSLGIRENMGVFSTSLIKLQSQWFGSI